MSLQKPEFVFDSVFEFGDYKAYLKQAFQIAGKKRGLRAKLAKAINVQSSYISGILNGSSDFSLEQAILVSSFLKHSAIERKYFILLVEKARAGSRELVEHFDQEIRKISGKRLNFKGHIRSTELLPDQDLHTYYSRWYYAAIHILVMIPEFQDQLKIARRLRLDPLLIKEALGFLKRSGLIEEKMGKLSPGKTRIHIGRDSPFTYHHHLNWRMKTIESLGAIQAKNFHYTLVMSCSKADIIRIQNLILTHLETVENLLPNSKDEAAYSLNVDLFEV